MHTRGSVPMDHLDRMTDSTGLILTSGVNRNQGAESTLAYLWTETRYLTARHAPGGNRALAAATARH
jgi:hypothetical protein